MKKVLIFSLSLVASMLFATDYQYLYWMVDVQDQEEFEFCYATVKMNGSTLSIYDGTEDVGTRLYADDDPTGLVAAEDGGVYSKVGLNDAYLGSTFLFELWSTSDKKIGTKSVSGSALTSFISQSMTEGGANAYMVCDFEEEVPEPTSGLLMLLGLAGLALKRKRA